MRVTFFCRPRAVRAAALALVVSIGVSGGACGLQISSDAEARDEWTRQYDVAGGATLEIKNTNGRINVRAGDGSRVDVRAVRIVRAPTDEAAKAALADFKIAESATADRVALDATSSSAGFTIGLSRSVDFDVTVPRDTHVVLATTNGDISAARLTGTFRVSATNASITTDALAGPVEVEATNGRVQIDLAAVAEGGVASETTNGAISLTLPRDARARLALRTTNGGISVSGLETAATQQSRQRLEATIGGGGPTIRLETTNGAIRVTGR